MSGATGPTGPAGPIGYVGYVGYTGPTGMTGQYGYNGPRGLPGRPPFPVSVQIFKSANTFSIPKSSSSATYLFDLTNLSTPALSGSNSTTISGLTASNTATATVFTFPPGQYYLKAGASVSSNIMTIGYGMQNTGQGWLTLNDSTAPETSIYAKGVISYNANTMYMTGYVNTSSTISAYLRMNLLYSTGGSLDAQLSPTYTQGNFASGAPSSSPPNVSMTIMKIA
jgi:hypothetical protein